MRRLILVAALMFLAAPAWAAVSYFAQVSAGANNGTSCANAIALSGVTWTAGNTYHLCGTVTSQVSPGTSGSAGNVITIIFETGAKISQSACGSTGCINLNGLSYIIIDGSPTTTPCGYVNQIDVACNGIIEATNSGTGLGSGDSIGVYALSNANHLEVRNLNINNMYVHSGVSDNAGNNYYAIWVDNTTNLIHNNVIHDALAAIKVEAGSTLSNYNNNHIYNINWGIFESAANSVNSITLDTIHDNDIHDFANWDTTADTFHHDGIFISGNSAATDITHIDIYNNYVHGTSSSAVTCAGAPGNGSCLTAFIYINTDSFIRVFNNLIVANAGDTGPNNAWVTFGFPVASNENNDSFINNTIIGGTVSGNSNCLQLVIGTLYTIENNVMSNCANLLWIKNSPTFTALDYNVYQASTLSWRIDSSFYATLANWRTNSSGDAHATATTGSLGLGTNSIPTSSSSFVVGAGTNLASLSITALNSDAGGTRRILVGAWEAGAYQYGSSPYPSYGGRY